MRLDRKRSRIKLGPEEYKQLKFAVFRRDGWKCRVCSHRCHIHAHHVVYRSDGGDDADWNLITLCHMCHDSVHTHENGKGLVILPAQEGGAVDANGEVKFLFLNSWLPKRRAA